MEKLGGTNTFASGLVSPDDLGFVSIILTKFKIKCHLIILLNVYRDAKTQEGTFRFSLFSFVLLY